jgi:hypothetical protein
MRFFDIKRNSWSISVWHLSRPQARSDDLKEPDFSASSIYDTCRDRKRDQMIWKGQIVLPFLCMTLVATASEIRWFERARFFCLVYLWHLSRPQARSDDLKGPHFSASSMYDTCRDRKQDQMIWKSQMFLLYLCMTLVAIGKVVVWFQMLHATSM